MDFIKKNITISHLPSIMLFIGYPIFWAELWWHKHNHGVSFPAVWIIFFVVVGLVVRTRLAIPSSLDVIKSVWKNLSGFQKVFSIVGMGLVMTILLVSAYAAYLPPHLMQEEDVLNYHYSLPRQHLIRNSFEFIPWSMCDLFPYPIQFGLAPYWFATVLPNKFPQLLFLLGLLGVTLNLSLKLKSLTVFQKGVIVVAILSAHHVGIQAGTAMLDLVITYLFLAAFDSFLEKKYILAAMEFSFYFWSKSFIPFQTIALLVSLGLVVWVLQKAGFQLRLSFSTPSFLKVSGLSDGIKKFILSFIISSIFVATPFLSKSLFIAGTPIYPFFVGTLPPAYQAHRSPKDWQRFLEATQEDLSMKDAYGMPRNLWGWVSHFWVVAVPENNVNNRFDYPLGLTYLLCLGPYLWLTIKHLHQKTAILISLFIALFWMSWWMGSQQSRFLYVPLILMYMIVFSEIKPTKIFLSCLLIALLSTSVSLVRAHYPDWGKNRFEVLNQNDQAMVALSQQYLISHRQDKLFLKNTEICYAQFPVRVMEEKFPYIIPIH